MFTATVSGRCARIQNAEERELILCEFHHGESWLTDQCDVSERSHSFDCPERNWLPEGPDWNEVAGKPVRIGTGRIGIGHTYHLQDANNSLVLLTLVEEDGIANSHAGKMLPRFCAPNAAEGEFADANNVGPTGSERSELDQPVAHWKQGFTFSKFKTTLPPSQPPCVDQCFRARSKECAPFFWLRRTSCAI